MIPLLRLPYLAIQEIIRSMSPKHIFFVSLLSKRMQKYVKCSIPKDSVQLELSLLKNDIRVRSGEWTSKPFIFVHKNLKDEGLAPYKLGTETIQFCPKNRLCHWVSPDMERISTVLIEYLAGLFNNPTASLKCFFAKEELTTSMIQCFRIKNLKIRSVSLMWHLSPKAYTMIMNLCSKVEFLSTQSGLPIDYEFTPTSTFTIDRLVINEYCGWVKLEHFIQCRSIRLSCVTSMNSKYMNSFLKKVVTTDCRLEELDIKEDFKLNFAVVVRGLTNKPIQPGNPVELVKRDGSKLQIDICFGKLMMRKL